MANRNPMSRRPSRGMPERLTPGGYRGPTKSNYTTDGNPYTNMRTRGDLPRKSSSARGYKDPNERPSDPHLTGARKGKVPNTRDDPSFRKSGDPYWNSQAKAGKSGRLRGQRRGAPKATLGGTKVTTWSPASIRNKNLKNNPGF